MKAMLIFMQETCNQLINCLDNYADTNEEFELKDTLGKYSMDTLATCAFGVNSESFSNSLRKLLFSLDYVLVFFIVFAETF